MSTDGDKTLAGDRPRDEPRYVLVTPARNEEAFIETTMACVAAQTVLPLKWVIVSDGSTDRTDELVQRFASAHPWIEFVRMPDRKERHFAGKVHAFNAGWRQVRGVDHDYIGCLDADISFDAGYFEYLLAQFGRDPRLGLAGTPFNEDGVEYDYRFSRPEHVSGACQLFRRECFESIGGYLPLKTGAVDLTAVVTARMNGWTTRTFTEKRCLHHRPMGTARGHRLSALFRSGWGDYRMGVHPLWQLLRSIYQMSRRPRIVGGSLLLVGYACAMVARSPRPVSAQFVQFRRKEQMQWLREYARRALQTTRWQRTQSRT
jgi:glycosyltransferase involved in cell wall biosynthesis